MKGVDASGCETSLTVVQRTSAVVLYGQMYSDMYLVRMTPLLVITKKIIIINYLMLAVSGLASLCPPMLV